MKSSVLEIAEPTITIAESADVAVLFYAYYAIALQAAERYDQASSYFRKHLAICGDRYLSYSHNTDKLMFSSATGLVYCARQVGTIEETLAFMEAPPLTASPANRSARLHALGTYYADTDDMERALDCFDREMRLWDSAVAEPERLQAIAETYERAGRLDRAQALLQMLHVGTGGGTDYALPLARFLKRHPDRIASVLLPGFNEWSNLASAAGNDRDWETARRLLDHTLMMDGAPSYLFNSRIYFTRNADEIERVAQNGLQRHPGDPSLLYYAAWLQIYRGNYVEAARIHAAIPREHYQEHNLFLAAVLPLFIEEAETAVERGGHILTPLPPRCDPDTPAFVQAYLELPEGRIEDAHRVFSELAPRSTWQFVQFMEILTLIALERYDTAERLLEMTAPQLFLENILKLRFYLALLRDDADAAEAIIAEVESLQSDAQSRHFLNVQLAVVRNQRDAAIHSYQWLAERQPMTLTHWQFWNILPPQGIKFLETAGKWADAFSKNSFEGGLVDHPEGF